MSKTGAVALDRRLLQRPAHSHVGRHAWSSEITVGLDSLRTLELGANVLSEVKEFQLHGRDDADVSCRSPESGATGAGSQVVCEGR